jgi:hypothetical protein
MTKPATVTVIMDELHMYSGVHQRAAQFATPGEALYRSEVPLEEPELFSYTHDAQTWSNVPSVNQNITPQALDDMIEQLRAYERRITKEAMDALNKRVLNGKGA